MSSGHYVICMDFQQEVVGIIDTMVLVNQLYLKFSLITEPGKGEVVIEEGILVPEVELDFILILLAVKIHI